jgi:hypothetical protein
VKRRVETISVSNRFLPEMKTGKYFFWLLFFFLLGVLINFLANLAGGIILFLAAIIIPPLWVIVFIWPRLVAGYLISERKVVLLPLANLAGGIILVSFLKALL